MTSTQSVSNPKGALPRPAIDAETLSNEIRIVQSVQNQRNIPALISGSLSAIGSMFFIDFSATVSSYAVFALAVQFLLLLPMLRSYLRLRGRSRPAHVSKRRIRTLEIYTLAMGLVWAVAIVLLMSSFSQINSVVVLCIMCFLAFGGAALSPSLPRASGLFAIPIFLACFIGGYFHNVLSSGLLLLLCVGGAVTVLHSILQSWRDVNQRVRLQLENLRAETERSQMLEQISSQLGKFMSPQLYQSVFSGKQKVKIESKRKKLTIFFSDIANFTEITEQLESEELTELLNRYLSEMSRIAIEYGATIDKFIGDAIVVYFGDPETKGVKEDANQCVRMAIAMQELVRKLGTEWIESGLERTFELRIGINTGYCTVGNFGSEDRMDYTIIGSQVNLAARLESVADVGGILLANETHSLVRDQVIAKEGEPIRIKGFARPVKTFRVVGIKAETNTQTQVFDRQESGVSIRIDQAGMSAKAKASARQTLNDALAHLEEATDAP